MLVTVMLFEEMIVCRLCREDEGIEKDWRNKDGDISISPLSSPNSVYREVTDTLQLIRKRRNSVL